MPLEHAIQKNLVIIFVLVKNVARNILDIIHVEIDIVLCAKNYAREKWIKKESSYLLDTKYFHIITTVPYELNEIFLYNQKTCYNILFKATSESILTLAKDLKWLGAKPSITSILHTWGQG